MEEPVNPFGETSDSTGPTHETAFAPILAPIQWYQPPRLGIIHLLAWVTVAAVLMKIDVAIESYSPSSPPTPRAQVLPVGPILEAAGQILTAAAIVGGFVVWRGCWRRKPGYLQPGHWMIAIESAIVLATLMYRIVFEIACQFYVNVSFTISGGVLVIAAILVHAGPFCYAAWRLPEPRRWRWVLIFEGLRFTVIFVAVFLVVAGLISPSWLGFCQTYESAPLLLAVLIAIAIDLAKGTRRDWLHWLGALLPLLQFLYYIAFRLLLSFLPVGP